MPFGHHQLHNRYRFEGKLLLETPLRLSSGRASDETDAPLMRNREGRPYIPGSSLRGAIRSSVERIIAGVGTAAGLRSCTLFAPGDCNENARIFQQEAERDEAQLAEFAENKLCDVCKLFGSTIYASRLVIEDASFPPEGDAQEKSLIRDGVGIDRDTGTAREGVKFDYEVLEKGPEFVFRMQVENLTDTDRVLVNLVLSLLKQELYVGGKQAAGLGKVRLEAESISVRGFEEPQAMWQALTAGEDPHQPLIWQEGV